MGKETIGKKGVAYNNSDVARGRISPIFSFYFVFNENYFDWVDYEFSHPFERPVEAGNSFYVGILAQKATRLGRLLDPGW